jgi:hypothetical protein
MGLWIGRRQRRAERVAAQGFDRRLTSIGEQRNDQPRATGRRSGSGAGQALPATVESDLKSC